MILAKLKNNNDAFTSATVVDQSDDESDDIVGTEVGGEIVSPV